MIQFIGENTEEGGRLYLNKYKAMETVSKQFFLFLFSFFSGLFCLF